MDNIISFQGYLQKIIYSNEDYKICAFVVDKNEFPFIEFNKYGNVSVAGDMPSLLEDIKYNIHSIKENNKYGTTYKVVSISPEKPIGYKQTYTFLSEILTRSQADELYKHYPNIIDDLIKDASYTPDLSIVKGIGVKTFEKIRDKILENYIFIELINEFHGLIKLGTLKKLFEKYSSIEKLRIQIKNDPYDCMCSLSGVGFKTADKIVIEMQKNGYDFGYDIIKSKQRCISYMLYRLNEEESCGHTYLTLQKMKSEVYENIPECKEHFIEALKNENFHLNKELLCVSKTKTYETEVYIANTIKEMLKIEVKPYEYNIDDYKNFDGYCLSDEQLKILELVSNNGISILSGYSGVGKTTSTKALLEMLDDNRVKYLLFAPTGKASKVMEQATHKFVKTIHRGLGYKPPKWTYDEYNKLPCDVVIIDEMSMVDIFLFEKVLKAIDIKRTRLLLIGDPAQLPSVSCGNVLHDLLSSQEVPYISLSKVFRYGEGGLMKVATDVRNCKEYLDGVNQKLTHFGVNKDYTFIQSSNEETTNDVLSVYKQLLTRYEVEDIQVLTAYRVGKSGTIALNNELQKIANKDLHNKSNIKVGETTYYKDDIVIQKVNNYHALMYSDEIFEEPEEVLIANGESGKIIDIVGNNIIIDFDGTKVIYERNDMNDVNLGYAISIHSSQGSSIPIVLLSTPSSQYHMLSSNLIYVGLTRMKKKCFHVGDKDIIDKVIHKKENFSRNTFLRYLLEC